MHGAIVGQFPCAAYVREVDAGCLKCSAREQWNIHPRGLVDWIDWREPIFRIAAQRDRHASADQGIACPKRRL